jgi:hypothetical protein
MKPENMTWQQYAESLEQKLHAHPYLESPLKEECNRRICDARGCQFPPNCHEPTIEERAAKRRNK